MYVRASDLCAMFEHFVAIAVVQNLRMNAMKVGLAGEDSEKSLGGA